MLFLALLDYVSRAHEINIRPSSVVPSSVVRLWHRLSLKLLHGLLSNFSCGFPWAICPAFFFMFEKKFVFDFLQIFFLFVNMGPYGSQNFKRYSSLKSVLNLFNFFLKFLLSGPHKSTVLDF